MPGWTERWWEMKKTMVFTIISFVLANICSAGELSFHGLGFSDDGDSSVAYVLLGIVVLTAYKGVIVYRRGHTKDKPPD